MATADKAADKAAGKAARKPATKPATRMSGKAASKTAGKHAAGAPVRSAASGAPSQAWGEDLAMYPDWLQRYMPAMHEAFNYVNRYLSVPALRAGMGKYMSNPVSGYLMILRTRGRKSGEMRDAPLGYVIQGDAVYCMAGFGRQTNWLLNIHEDPKVEVILPGRSFSGVAQEVTDDAERLAVLPPLLRSMGLIVGSLGMGNPWKMTPTEIARKCEGLPLVRVRSTGIAAGPEDPGGKFWVVPAVVSALGLLWLLRHAGNRKRR
jgi:deazaflavin-dependent oxidoreductase (nitroreductase family)